MRKEHHFDAKGKERERKKGGRGIGIERGRDRYRHRERGNERQRKREREKKEAEKKRRKSHFQGCDRNSGMMRFQLFMIEDYIIQDSCRHQHHFLLF